MRLTMIIAGSILLTPCAVAVEPSDYSVSGSVGAVSDYRWRGVSQTRNDPAAQADIAIKHKSGWFGDLWASAPTKNSGDVELDLTIGKSFDLADGELDISIVGYIYPNLDGADYTDFAAAYEREFGSWVVRGRMEYAPPQSNLDQHSTYAAFEAEKQFGETGFALSAGVGWEAGEFTLDGEKWDYALSGKYRIGPASFNLTYSGTDESAPQGSRNIYGGRLSVGFGAMF